MIGGRKRCFSIFSSGCNQSNLSTQRLQKYNFLINYELRITNYENQQAKIF
jgi:hypothetical protein